MKTEKRETNGAPDFLSVFFRVRPWLVFLHRFDQNTIRLPRPGTVPRDQPGRCLVGQPSPPTGFERKSTSEPCRSPQPAAVPDHANFPNSKPGPFHHDRQGDGTEMGQMPGQV